MEPQTPIDVQRIPDKKIKRAEYDKQRKLRRKIDWESLPAIDAEYVFCTVWHVYVLRVRHTHDPMLLPQGRNCIFFIYRRVGDINEYEEMVEWC
jgi:hypothetical protein